MEFRDLASTSQKYLHEKRHIITTETMNKKSGSLFENQKLPGKQYCDLYILIN